MLLWRPERPARTRAISWLTAAWLLACRIAIGGAVGTGLIIGSGTALPKAGPVGLLLGYIIMGAGASLPASSVTVSVLFAVLTSSFVLCALQSASACVISLPKFLPTPSLTPTRPLARTRRS